MTYEEVKKGLECCLDRTKGCKICPYYDDEDCLYAVRKDTLVLINRLEQEKEQIRKETAKGIINDLFNACDASQYDCVEPNYIFYLAEKYGVEVDE